MKFQVSRKMWLHGEGATGSYLLRSTDGLMCCLGFRALACGMTPDQIRDVKAPNNALELYPDTKEKWLKFIRIDGRMRPSIECNIIMRINDRRAIVDYHDLPDYSEQDRETDLIQAFARLGDEIEFVD